MKEEQILAYRYKGKRYDCGSKIGYLEATLTMARKHPEVGAQFEQLLQSFQPQGNSEKRQRSSQFKAKVGEKVEFIRRDE
jgi:UTP--glucose-1-phosphate uridylyltransferase